MYLTVNCKSCNEMILLKEKAPSRLDLVRKAGNEELNLKCIACNQETSYHVDKIYASASPKNTLIGLIIGGAIGIITFLFLINTGWISTVSLGIIGATTYGFYSVESSRVHTFNQHKVRGRGFRT